MIYLVCILVITRRSLLSRFPLDTVSGLRQLSATKKEGSGKPKKETGCTSLAPFVACFRFNIDMHSHLVRCIFNFNSHYALALVY